MNIIKYAKWVFASLFALTIAACGGTTPREAELAERNNVVHGFDVKLQALKQLIEEKKEKLVNAPKEARPKCQAEIDALIKHFDKASETQRQLKESLRDAADAAWSKASEGMERFNSEFTDLQNEIHEADKTEIIAGFEDKLADLELKIEDGKRKLANMSADAGAQFEKVIADLDEKRLSAKEKLIELKQNTQDGAADAWQKVKTDLDKAWDDIQAAARRLFE